MFQAQPTNKTKRQSQDTVKGLRVKPPGTIKLYEFIEISSQGPLYLTSETIYEVKSSFYSFNSGNGKDT